MKRPTIAQNIALSVTATVALILLLLLLGIHLSLPQPSPTNAGKKISMASIEPEVIPEPLLEDQELFIEPELIDDGTPETPDNDLAQADAVTPPGEPQQAPEPNDRLVVNGPNPKQNQEAEPLVAANKPNDIKTTKPSPKDKPDQKIQSEEKAQVSFHNGRRDGKAPTASSGNGNASSSSSAHGEAQGGRSLLNNPPVGSFTISSRITVTVTIQVKADGSVVKGSASVTGLSSKYNDLRHKLIAAAEKTKWTPKAGAPTVRGTIYWTLTPGAK